jgi:hypothetical protein
MKSLSEISVEDTLEKDMNDDDKILDESESYDKNAGLIIGRNNNSSSSLNIENNSRTLEDEDSDDVHSVIHNVFYEEGGKEGENSGSSSGSNSNGNSGGNVGGGGYRESGGENNNEISGDSENDGHGSSSGGSNSSGGSYEIGLKNENQNNKWVDLSDISTPRSSFSSSSTSSPFIEHQKLFVRRFLSTIGAAKKFKEFVFKQFQNTDSLLEVLQSTSVGIVLSPIDRFIEDCNQIMSLIEMVVFVDSIKDVSFAGVNGHAVSIQLEAIREEFSSFARMLLQDPRKLMKINYRQSERKKKIDHPEVKQDVDISDELVDASEMEDEEQDEKDIESRNQMISAVLKDITQNVAYIIISSLEEINSCVNAFQTLLSLMSVLKHPVIFSCLMQHSNVVFGPFFSHLKIIHRDFELSIRKYIEIKEDIESVDDNIK